MYRKSSGSSQESEGGGEWNNSPNSSDGQGSNMSSREEIDDVFSSPEHNVSEKLSEPDPKMEKKKPTIPELLEPIFEFMATQSNFESLPASSKVMVFDTDLKVNDALKIACENEMGYASIWDKKSQRLSGMMTISDLVNIVIYCGNRKELLQNMLNKKSIRVWKVLAKEAMAPDGQLGHCRALMPDIFVYTSPEDTLWNSMCLMMKHQIHRLPVLAKDDTLLHVITNVSVLVHLVRYIDFQLGVFALSLEQLNLGIAPDVFTCTSKQKVYDVLQEFVKRGISCAPVIKDGVVDDLFVKEDVVYLFREGNVQMDGTIGEVLQKRPKSKIYAVRRSEKFGTVLRHLVGTRLHKLVCIDEEAKAVGVVTITDVFHFFLENYGLYVHAMELKKMRSGRRGSGE